MGRNGDPDRKADRDALSERQAQAALRESEERFAMFAASSTDALWVRDARTYSFEYVNPAVHAVYGVTPAEVLVDAEVLNDLIVPELRASVSANIARVSGGEVVVQEYRIRRPTDGSVRWIRSTGFPLRDHQGLVRRIGAIAQDITDRKLAEEGLRASEVRQAFLLKLSDALRPIADAGEIQWTACRMLGEHLNANRVCYVEVNEDESIVRRDYVSGVRSIAGRWKNADFGRAIEEALRTGRVHVESDLQKMPALSEAERANYRAIQVAAQIVVTLVKEGRWIANFGVHCATPRTWRPDEVSLVQDVAERTWAALERARAESALRTSEERYRTLFESMDEAFYLMEVMRDDDGKPSDILYLEENDAAQRLVGTSARGRRLSSINPSFDREWLEILARVNSSGRAERFERHSQVTGRWHDYHVFAAHSAPSHVGVLSSDVTERKAAQDKLRENERVLRIALEAGRMGTYRFDVSTGIEEWSDREYEMLGLRRTASAPTRELFLSIVHPDDLHRVEFGSNDERPEGTPLDTEFRIIRPDTGEVRWISAHALALFGDDGKPSELIGVNIDTTEQRRLEASMHSTEERLREFSETSSDVLWIRRASDLQWEYLSPAFHKIYGISREDALRGDNLQSWVDLIVPEDREHALAAIDRVRSGQRATFEYRIRRPEDGQTRWLRNTDFPMRDESGKVVRIGGIGHDLTELKHAEEHQKLLLAELQHRVRNTLAVIRSIVSRTAETSSDLSDFAMHIDGRIGAFARVQATVTRDPAMPVDLEYLIGEEARLVGAREGENILIRGPRIGMAPKPAETMALAMHELTTNALKYGALSVPRGSIEVTWTATDEFLDLLWTERGLKDLPSRPERRGFGVEMLERSLPYELGATTRLDFQSTGLNCHLLIPLARLVM